MSQENDFSEKMYEDADRIERVALNPSLLFESKNGAKHVKIKLHASSGLPFPTVILYEATIPINGDYSIFALSAESAQ